MAIRNDASLRGKIRAIAKREGLRPQEVLQMFLFEHLLLWPGLVLWTGCFEGCWLLLVVLCPLACVLVG